MAPLTERHPRYAPSLLHAARLGVLVLLAALLAAAGDGRAQAPSADKVFYFPQASFKIPFEDPKDGRTNRVHLYISEDRGKTWDKTATAAVNEKAFHFTAQRDGLYWFTTQTEDVNGRLTPPSVAQLPPMLQMVVDTKKPIVALKSLQPREGSVGVEWDIRDDNLDLQSLRLDYRPAGGTVWTPIPIDLRAFGSREWNPGVGGQFEVRIQAADLAKNKDEQTVVVGAGLKPATGQPSGTAPQTADNVIWVSKRQFHLDFKLEEVGPSGVPKIEVWRCTPTLEWQKVTTVDAKPPLTIQTDGQGRYGFTLIPISGVELAPHRPARGDAPQVWVEVDETLPTVRIQRVDVGRGADHGNVTISWEASDNRLLAAKPINIAYSDKATGGEWTVIATQLANTRSYVWKMEEGKVPYQFFIKVEAADMAGNIGSDVTREAVKVDLKIPRAVDLQIKPVTTVTPVAPLGGPP